MVFVVLIFYIVCFLLSFLISSLEFAHNNYPLNKMLLYKNNIYFIIYGVGHGVISSGILFFMYDSNLFEHGNHLIFLLTAIGVGIGIKGFTHISFYEREIEGAGSISYGPKQLFKMIEKYLSPHVKERHDIAIKKYIQKKEKKLNDFDKAELITALKKYLPLEHKKNRDYLETSFLALMPEWEPFDIQEYYIEKYGINRYNMAIKDLLTKTDNIARVRDQ